MSGKRPLLRIVLGLAVAAVLVGVLVVRLRARETTSGSREKAQSAAAARVIPVVVTEVARRDVPIDLEGIGSAVPLQSVLVRSQVDGRLEKVFFDEGQLVKRGDVLAQIDARPYRIALQQAEGNLARDQATLESARGNLERLIKLQGKQFVSTQDVQNQRALVGQTQGALAVDQAQIAAAKLNLDYARITAPIDGITGIRQIDPGNFVRAGETGGIVIITQLDPIAVVFTLPQDDLPKVSEQLARGAQLGVDAYDREGSVLLGSGTLRLIDNQVVAATGTIRLKAVLPNPERRLWPNLFVKARLHVDVEKDALVVPTAAIQRGPRGPFVYVVKADQTADARLVEIALALADLTVVRQGVKEGEQVVIEGQGQLRPGARVSVRGSGAAREKKP